RLLVRRRLLRADRTATGGCEGTDNCVIEELAMSDSHAPSSIGVSPVSSLSRRQFLAAGAGAFALPLVDVDGEEKPAGHHIPADKHLDPAWVKRLFEVAPRTYRGDALACIGMPV